LIAFLVLGHGRRQLLWFEVTGYPTADGWPADHRAFPGLQHPACCATTTAYGHVFTSPGKGDGYPRSTDFASLALAECYAERLIAAAPQCLDQMIIFGETHLRRILSAFGVLQSSAYAPGITKKVRPCIE
jgi:hypothetical protein